ncbi:MAG: hypothetical protein Q4E09_01690 [Eubacteriales bacterium]|nr:hypothetical protein [Eubacteriales bacterium]
MWGQASDFVHDEIDKKTRRRRNLRWLIVVALLLALAATFIYLATHKQETASLAAFSQSLEKSDYPAAMASYYEVQAKATDLGRSDADRDFYRQQQLAMEKQVSAIAADIWQRLQAGENLSEDDLDKLEGFKFLSSIYLIPEIKLATEQLLDGQLAPDAWLRELSALKDISYLSDFIDDLLEQQESLFAKIDAFKEAGELETGDNWQLTWSKWEALADDQDGSRLAREYAAYRLRSFQGREYMHLMDLTEQMMEAGQYYTAYQLLSLMHEVFPDREELTSRLVESEGLLPASIEEWDDDVLCLSIRPLVVRPELAFDRGEDPTYAQTALISQTEFLRILDNLYKDGYVLISPRQFYPWPERRFTIRVPSGKKPLILIFDRWQYSVLNQVCGTTSKLYLDDEGELLAEAGDDQGRDLDAIPILEDFLEQHPDFAFDGAKAVLALNVDESLFGFTVSDEEVAESKAAWARVGQLYPTLTSEEMSDHRERVADLLAYLQRHGWDFASAGYMGHDTASLDLTDLEEEVGAWSSLLNTWLTEARVFAFPNGSHVYNQSDSLDLILSRGFNIFFGQGPKPYRFMDRRFLHFDSLAVNGNTLTYPGSYLSDLFDSDAILDRNLR